MKKMVLNAIEGYLDSGVACSFVHSMTGVHCVNTKDGHAKGHQGANGALLAAGGFEGGSFDSTSFQDFMTKSIHDFLRELRQVEDDQRLATARRVHRDNVPRESSWVQLSSSKLGGSRTCFGCLFKEPQYRLPCDHFLCDHCLGLFDQSTEADPDPSLVIHRECYLCANKDASHWPFELRMKPPLGGLRVLSLDGGGVRGIVELITLKRILTATGLSMRPCDFFDLFVGTSAGEWGPASTRKFRELTHVRWNHCTRARRAPMVLGPLDKQI